MPCLRLTSWPGGSDNSQVASRHWNRDKLLPYTPPGVLNVDFTFTFEICREVELEQVLTTYTKINKSASIFLGSSKSDDNSTSLTSGSRAATSTRPSHHHRSQQQSNMHGIIVNGTEGGLWLFAVYYKSFLCADQSVRPWQIIMVHPLCSSSV